MVSFFFGSLALIPFQFFTPLPTYMGPTAIVSLIALIAGASLIAFTAYATALRSIAVSTATILSTSEVLIAAFFGWLFLKEQLGSGNGGRGVDRGWDRAGVLASI